MLILKPVLVLIALMLAIIIFLSLPGCASSRLTGYNLKASVGQTEYDNGSRSLYTGGAIDAHFDVRP